MPGPDVSGEPAPTVSRRGRRNRDAREAPFAAGDRNEAALLEVARDLLLKGEFRAATVTRIAKRAGISRQGFYFYFRSKDELLAQLVTTTLNRVQVWRATIYDPDTDPADAIRQVMGASVAGWRDNRAILGAAIEMASRAPVITQHWIAVAEETADFLADMIVASTRLEELRDHDTARRTLVTITWALERNCYMHFVHGSDESDAALAERLSLIYIRGCGIE